MCGELMCVIKAIRGSSSRVLHHFRNLRRISIQCCVQFVGRRSFPMNYLAHELAHGDLAKLKRMVVARAFEALSSGLSE